ncbi:phage tail protein [Pseudomonas sp. GL-RE-26]|uniref:phage tail protein n=1 Tax=Pseudomonas sp. GL-RE-26 TaxID=2832390 RepID=UPI001CBBC8A3|nr:phage tail protein [Pseudomonas sp. GL-RE-26]
MSNIDWNKLVTKAMKDAAALAAHLALMRTELAAKNARAVSQIARIEDRIDTIGYGVDAGVATEEDEAEQASLIVTLKAWKTYKFALGKVTTQPTWHAAPLWPAEPPIPVIAANPETNTAETM